MAEEALAVARRTGDAVTEAHALIAVAMTRARSEPGAPALDMLAQARMIAERARAHDLELEAIQAASHLLEGMGQHEQAAAVARQGLACAREYGLARSRGTLQGANLAEPLMSLGRWDEAAEVIENALALRPLPNADAALRQLSGDIALARGDSDRATRSAAAMRRAIAGVHYREPHHLPLARLEMELHLAQGRAGEALAAAEGALGRFDLRHSPRYAWPLIAAGARACGTAIKSPAAARDHELSGRARRLLGRLRAQAEQIDAAGPVEQAHRLTFTAEAAQAGDLGGAADADALDAWDAAATAWQRTRSALPAGVRAAVRGGGGHGPR